MVKRLRRRPLTAKTGVRVPMEVPESLPVFDTKLVGFFCWQSKRFKPVGVEAGRSYLPEREGCAGARSGQWRNHHLHRITSIPLENRLTLRKTIVWRNQCAGMSFGCCCFWAAGHCWQLLSDLIILPVAGILLRDMENREMIESLHHINSALPSPRRFLPSRRS